MNQSAKQPNLAADFEGLDIEGGDLEQLFSDAPATTQSLDRAVPSLNVLKSIPVRLTLEVDSVEIMLGELLELSPGQVLPLDKKVGAPLDVRVNGTLVAQAEVVVVDGKYGLRLTEVLENINLAGFASTQ